MKKTAATKGKSAVVPRGAEKTDLVPVNPDQFVIHIKPSDRADDAVALLARAKALTIEDKATHGQALRELREGKTIKRDIAAHWKTLKDAINKLRTHVLDLERGEVGPAEDGIAELEKKALAWDRAEEARVEREQAEERAAATERANADRERELADAEAAALEAEAASENLSERESAFVAIVAKNLASNLGHNGAADAAAKVGYKDPAKRAEILMSTPKIWKAIEGLKTAAAIRQQADARRTQPVIPDVVNVEANTAKVSGVSKRVTYGCESADVPAMLEAWKRGELPATAFLANMPFLNEQARTHKDLFEALYPGCKLARREGYAG